MKTLFRDNRKKGYALITALVITSISLMILMSALGSTSTNTKQTIANAQYFTSASAAEAATEKVLSKFLKDYQTSGEATVYASLANYQAMVPNSGENNYWDKFEFSDGNGGAGHTFIDRIKASQYIDLDSEYKNLKGWASTYRIISNAREKNTSYSITAAVAQDIQTASIPIFQFAIFYNIDLELHSMTTMDILGRVHSNGNLYTYPSKNTTFWSDVTTAGTIIKTRKPGDPDYSKSPPDGRTIFKAKSDTKVSSLTLPIGTNNTPDAVREILNPPPSDESMDSVMGKQRYYNKAELVITLTNHTVTALAKAPFSTTTYDIPYSNLKSIINTNVSFTDQREDKVVKATELDVSKLTSWANTNVSVQNAIGTVPNIIYVADNRKLSSSQLGAVRLVNGSTLPAGGLTVATPNPLYIKGNYNQPTSKYLNTTNTTTTQPASLVSDALTILSSNWDDSKSNYSYANRDASSTTVNAAVLTGIVETSTTKHIYSGGAHNLGRFLEDWSGRTFTYNGSMVVLFPSSKATGAFQQPGAYYYPPARDYSFDLNFMDGTKLPPGTPDLRVMIRGRWALVPPNKTDFGSSLY
jgi:hypothetical protein